MLCAILKGVDVWLICFKLCFFIHESVASGTNLSNENKPEMNCCSFWIFFCSIWRKMRNQLILSIQINIKLSTTNVLIFGGIFETKLLQLYTLSYESVYKLSKCYTYQIITFIHTELWKCLWIIKMVWRDARLPM